MKTLVAWLMLAVAVPAVAADTTTDPVRVEIVLMRHGVRAPTKPAATYEAYAEGRWPDWPVAPGMLTPHGREGMQAIGGRLREVLRADGAMTASCANASSLVVIGDSTPRNRESSAALVAGLAPGCGLSFLATPGETNNALFHFGKDDDEDSAPAAVPAPPAELADLQSVLLGCAPAQCRDLATRQGKRLLMASPADAARAMKLAGTLSENLMLAYAEGLPLADVAFGRADVAMLGRLITLHNAQFAATKKAMPAAAAAGSNLVAHIVATLDAARGQTPSVDPLTPVHQGVVVLVGHDTNLANVAGVLGLDWHDAQRPDDYPPGGALLFGVARRHGNDVIVIRALMPSMDALRTNRFDAAKAMPVRVAGCRAIGECTVAEFAIIARKGIDPSRVDARLPAMSVQAVSAP